MTGTALETRIGPEGWDTFSVEGLPLLNEQGKELGSHHLPVHVIESVYRTGDAAGYLLILTSRQAGILCGYVIFWMGAHPHSGVRQAWLDAVYVAPAMRRSGIATRLMQEAERRLREAGCQRVSQGVPLRNPALGRLLEREGYEAVELAYSKPLASSE